MATRTALRCALALAALAVAIEPLLLRSLGSHAGTLSHWWCSSSSAPGAPHAAGAAGLGAALLTPLKTLAPHWPHFLPILLAFATLVYLWRANAPGTASARRANAPGPASVRTSRAPSG